ncbi:MAG: hypothetical protein LR017_04325, partial [Candidatus Pacebacteria bacterium]|nr:hypothetical protein [Candidatus Paceibacterota bacterium]
MTHAFSTDYVNQIEQVSGSLKASVSDIVCTWTGWWCPRVVETSLADIVFVAPPGPTSTPPGSPPLPPSSTYAFFGDTQNTASVVTATTAPTHTPTPTTQHVHPTEVIEKYFTIYQTAPGTVSGEVSYEAFKTLEAIVDKHVNSVHHKGDGRARTFTDLEGELVITESTSLQDTSATTLTLSGALTGTSGTFTTLGVGTTSPSDTLAVDGAVYLADITAPTDATNRLYNVGSDLFWNGNTLSASTTGNWSASGGDVYRLTGNVGIGTSSPASTLDVWGTLQVGTSDNGFFVEADGRILIGTSTAPTSDALTIVKTNSSNIQLESTAGGSGGLDMIGFRSNNNSPIGQWRSYNAQGDRTDALTRIASFRDDNSDAASLFFATQPAGGDLTERMVINSEGNIGIGTTSPSSALQVMGDIQINNENTIGGGIFRGLNTGPELPTRQTAFIDGEWNAQIYQTGTNAGTYPFDAFGRLII